MAGASATTPPAATLARILARALLVAAVAVPLVAWGLDRALGRDVLLVSPHDAKLVALNRSLWVPGEPVAEIYGSPLSAPVRVLVGDEGALVRPPEDPALALLAVGAGRPHPIQVQSLWLVARLVALGVGAVGVGLLAAQRLAFRRRPAPARS